MHRRLRPVSAALAASVALATSAVGTPASAHGGSSIEGTVTSAAGEPLADVCVVASRIGFADQTYSGTTDAAGSFDVIVRGGDYVVAYNRCEQRRPGFAPEYFDDAVDIDQAATVRVEEETATAGLDAALAPTGSLSGVVTDEESGDGVEGICVVAESAADDWTRRATTGAQGAYRVDDLRAGDYVVLFEDCSDPLTYVSERYDDLPADGAHAEEPRAVAVRSGEDSAGVDAALTEGGVVAGRVTSVHNGEEQQFVCVALYRSDSRADDADSPVARDITGVVRDAETFTSFGAFVLEGIRPGTYDLAFNPVDRCGSDAFATSWYDDAATRDAAHQVVVRAGETLTGLEAVLQPLPSTSLACSPDDDQDRFSDVPSSNVHRQAIACLASYGITTGRGDGTYGPSEPVRRDQLASFVTRLLVAANADLPASPPDAFDDDDGNVHELAINQLTELGVVEGAGARRYAPTQTVSRGQMATFLVNGYEAATGLSLRAPQDRFADDDGTTHEQSIDKAATAGITAGTPEGTYAPAAPVRRDQMASFLARLLDRVQRDITHGDPSQG